MDKEMGIGLREGAEESRGLHVERVDQAHFNDVKPGIEKLKHNLLDASEGSSFAARSAELSGIAGELDSSKGGEAFLIKRNGEIVAFVALKRRAEPHEVAHIEQFRVARADDEHLILELLQELAIALKGEGFDKAALPEMDMPHSVFERARKAEWFESFFIMSKSRKEERDS